MQAWQRPRPLPASRSAEGTRRSPGRARQRLSSGHYDYRAIGTGPAGQTLAVQVTGEKDPGYGSTSKIISEAAVCLTADCPDLPGGIYTLAAAMGAKLRERLIAHAGLTFSVPA